MNELKSWCILTLWIVCCAYVYGYMVQDKDGLWVDDQISLYASCNGHSSCKRWWIDWTPWTQCSRSCGGGSQSREGHHWCKCKSWRHGNQRCHNIPNEREERGCEQWCAAGRGNYNNGCQCGYIYYGYCCELDCPTIKWCDKYWCNAPPSTCTQCDAFGGGHFSTSAYWLNNNECTPRCNWLDHWCWPGICDENKQYLASTCQCEPGFARQTPNELTTKCQLVHKPKIETCRLGIESVSGETFNSTFVGNTTSCDSTRDTFVNVQPKELFFVFESSLRLPRDPPKDPVKHKYVNDFHFGIVDGDVTMFHYPKSGAQPTRLIDLDMPSEAICNIPNFNPLNPADGLVSCKSTHSYHYGTVQDGDKLCHYFKPYGSGYVRIKNMVNQQISGKHLYAQTITDVEKCFRFDFTPADHCANQNPPCNSNPLQIGPRIQRYPNIVAHFSGYYDPDPQSAVTGPSGVHNYIINIHKMQVSDQSQQVNLEIAATHKIMAGTEHYEFSLPEVGTPMLYAVYLDTVDLARNFRRARRFVLYDNTSQLAIDERYPLRPITANPSTNYTWQVNLKPIIFDWREHFYNDWFRHTNFLKPIKSDKFVTGIYEQIDDPLPVKGTTNVHGITEFLYRYNKYSQTSSRSVPFRPISLVTDQKVTLNDLYINDGDTVDVEIQGTDINRNTILDTFKMYIDSSKPVLQNLWLTKDGYDQLFYHNSKDLSTMNFVFEAFDPHSNLKTVKWRLGTTPQSKDIGQGSLPIHKYNNTNKCVDTMICTCPIIGVCSQLNFTLQLNHLIGDDVHKGDHNREYFFYIEVVNEANLLSIGEVTILVDDSPPEVGVVIDGPLGSTDRDFQSNNLLQWHWRSFIDHESGISKYHIAAGHRCFTIDELKDIDSFTQNIEVLFFLETKEQHAEYNVSSDGIYFLSVIAFNKAMDPSKAVCSSGVLIDKTSPTIKHLHLHSGQTQESIACSANQSIWYVNKHRIAEPLEFTAECRLHCTNHVEIDLIRQKFTFSNNGTVIIPPIKKSKSLCNRLPTYSSDQMLFVPTDIIEISWESEEKQSQIHDYEIGVSSDKHNNIHPDIIGYKTTHNRTHYKCVHCGLSEGQIFTVQIRVTNKAGLIALQGIGPIVIDLTPPVYKSGLRLDIDKVFTLSWPVSAFYDEEDVTFLTDYEWALGTIYDPQSVENWQKVIVTYSDINSTYVFKVSYSKEKLQNHDQHKGHKYIFTVKAYNRAGLYKTVSTDPYLMFGQALPTNGQIYHVSPTNYKEEHIEKIGYQAEDDILCVKLKNFYHTNNELEMMLGIGTEEGVNNILPSLKINTTDGFCFDNLSLQHLKKYFINAYAFNKQGGVNVSSNGIFIGTLNEIYEFSLVTQGLDCETEFKEIDRNVVLQAGQSLDYILTHEIDSVTKYTIAITQEWLGSLTEIKVRSSLGEIHLDSWQFTDSYITKYFMIDLLEQNQTFSIFGSHDMILSKIGLSPCIINPNIQASTKAISGIWTFRPEVISSKPHFKYNIQAHKCTAQRCYDGGLIYQDTETSENSFLANLNLDDGLSYTIHVSVCFGTSCLQSIQSKGITVDTHSATGSFIEASIKPLQKVLGKKYKIVARWDAFKSLYGLQDSTIKVYDWGLASLPTGGNMLFPWRRTLLLNGENFIHVDTQTELKIHDWKTIYFVIRTYNDGHVQSLKYTEAELIDPLAPLSVPLYDLPVDYEGLDKLNDILHSNQLGDLAKRLHNDEVDFSSNIKAIAGAVQGISCEENEWWLQEHPDINCRNSRKSKDCIKYQRTKSKNVVQFRGLEMEYAHQYFICVYTSGGKCSQMAICSNGFFIDIVPPINGQIIIGSNGRNGQSDNTSLLVRWTGFHDIETDVLTPIQSGIKEYFFSLGTSRNNDDTRAIASAGISNHVTVTGLNLVSGKVYFVSVKACDHVDLCSSSSSSPILIDATPPFPGNVFVDFINFGNKPSDTVIRWDNFTDPESGIDEYQLGIGNKKYTQDVSSFHVVNGYVSLFDGSDIMKDGHIYFFQIKAVNKVNLWTIVNSMPVLYDSTPPTPGYVRFGSSEENLRYTTNVNEISIHWGGFADPNSGILYYRFCVGSKSGLCDVHGWQDVGLNTYIQKNLDLVPGMKYFVSVEACNGVLLCIKASSSPLVADNTPPMPGVVQVGSNGQHNMYHSSNTSLVAMWLNFHDPQSGIRDYSWCIGQSPGTCNVRSLMTAHQSEIQYLTKTSLPIATPLFVTVVATNNVGLKVQNHSPQFIVDISPPVIKLKPVLSPMLSLKWATQFDRSVLNISWDFTDDESPIWSHSISIHTHHNSRSLFETKLIGDVKSMTHGFALREQLKDGNRYVVSVTACNGAELCTVAESVDTLVDSSPPHIGGFIEPLSWINDVTSNTSKVNLTWEGFDDAHSAIDAYYISLGSKFNGQDISNGFIRITHNDSSFLQQHIFDIKGTIKPYTMVYLSISAENGVGLLSDVAKTGVFALKSSKHSGRLDIEKHSCDMHYCSRDCTCAVLNQKCESKGKVHECTELKTTEYIKVYDGVKDNSIKYTASSACLRAFWEKIDDSKPITRFEWTVGAKGSEPGSPVFDLVHDKYWFDVETTPKSIFCVSQNQTLTHGLDYVYYVKSWHSFNEYTLHTSNGVKIDTTPPKIGMGRAVRDMDEGFNEEIDFTNNTNTVQIDWDRVFSDVETGIACYTVSIGTTPGGNEIRGPENVGLVTRFTLKGLILKAGYKYYTTVHARNGVGMVTSASSDGLLIDTEPPIPGVVFSAINFQDKSHRSISLEVSWHSFSDLHSFINYYEWSIARKDQGVEKLLFRSNHFNTQLSLTSFASQLNEGVPYVVYVRAVDAAGHISQPAYSTPFVMDKSPPIGFGCSNYSVVELNDELYCEKCDSNKTCTEYMHVCNTKSPIKIHRHKYIKVQLTTDQHHPMLRARLNIGDKWDWIHFERQLPGLYVHQSSDLSETDNELLPKIYVFKGELSHVRIKIFTCNKHEVSKDAFKIVQTGPVRMNAHWAIDDPDSRIKSIHIGFGTNLGGFQLLPLTSIGQASSSVFSLKLQHSMKVHGVLVAENYAGLTTVFRTTPMVIDWTPPDISDVVLQIQNVECGIYNITVTWIVTEDESTVQDCHWALGLLNGGSDLLSWTHTSSVESESKAFVTLHHGDIITASIMCTNHIGLTGSGSSSPFTIITKPPDQQDAYIDFIPQSVGAFEPRGHTQAVKDVTEFHFNGFKDITGIAYYEYSIKDALDWIRAPLTDHIIVDGEQLDQNVNMSIRAVNKAGYKSQEITSVGRIEMMPPHWNGLSAGFNHTDFVVSLNWSDIFDWEGQGHLMFVLYVGSEIGSANHITGLETMETTFTLKSSKWVSPGECFVHIIAVAPSGLYTTYTELIIF